MEIHMCPKCKTIFMESPNMSIAIVTNEFTNEGTVEFKQENKVVGRLTGLNLEMEPVDECKEN